MHFPQYAAKHKDRYEIHFTFTQYQSIQTNAEQFPKSFNALTQSLSKFMGINGFDHVNIK